MGILKKLENIFSATGMAEEGDAATARMIMADEPGDRQRTNDINPEPMNDGYTGLNSPPAKA